jgi:hypothetical protein
VYIRDPKSINMNLFGAMKISVAPVEALREKEKIG